MTIPTPATPRTVLLVDDDPRLRIAMRRALEAAGMEVLEAPYAEQAMRMWKRQRHRIDVVVVDVVMPGRSGPALAAELAADKPELTIILISGSSTEHLERNGVVDSGFSLLRKPFPPAELLRRVSA